MDVDPELAATLRTAAEDRVTALVEAARVAVERRRRERADFEYRRTLAKQLLHAAKLERNRESA